MGCVYTHTHTHTMKYYSAIGKNEIMPCSNFDGPRDDHTKRSKLDRKRQFIPLNVKCSWDTSISNVSSIRKDILDDLSDHKY